MYNSFQLHKHVVIIPELRQTKLIINKTIFEYQVYL